MDKRNSKENPEEWNCSVNSRGRAGEALEMTSLFRRNSNGGSKNGGPDGGGGSGGSNSTSGQLNNSRPNRQIRRLEFNQAMMDFKTMFPTMEYEVIECVLRSNNGAVDATIDQLLQMSIDGNCSDDSSDSDDSIPPEVSGILLLKPRAAQL